MQRANQIVMALLRLIVNRRAPLHNRHERSRIEDFAGSSGAPNLFGEAQGGAAITIRHPHQTEAGIGIERKRLRLAAFRPGEKFLDRRPRRGCGRS